MNHPWWETMLLQISAVVIPIVIGAFATWVAHKKGWTAGPLKALGAWLDRNTPTTAKITLEVETALIDVVRKALEHPSSLAPTSAAESAPHSDAVVPDVGKTSGS